MCFLKHRRRELKTQGQRGKVAQLQLNGLLVTDFSFVFFLLMEYECKRTSRLVEAEKKKGLEAQSLFSSLSYLKRYIKKLKRQKTR